ncbi:MAG: hypothetical protein AAGB97_09180, partial [Dehalococcoidia bacterium]
MSSQEARGKSLASGVWPLDSFDTLDKAMISRHEQGQTLVYVLLFLVVGSLLVASLVPFLGAGFRRQAA